MEELDEDNGNDQDDDDSHEDGSPTVSSAPTGADSQSNSDQPLSVAKQRKPTSKKIRKAVRMQFGYVGRDLKAIENSKKRAVCRC